MIDRGFVAIFQKCNYHKFVVKDFMENIIINDLIQNNKNLILDSQFGRRPYYKRHSILANKIDMCDFYCSDIVGLKDKNTDNSFMFFDAPFVHLEQDWVELYYRIDFQDFICYSKTQDTDCMYYQVSKFNWFLEISAKRNENNEWNITSNKYSTNEEIYSSFESVNGVFKYDNFRNLAAYINDNRKITAKK
jgi:hypothetical protein